LASREILLPSILAADNGHSSWQPPEGGQVGLLLRDIDLETLIHRATMPGPPLALDIDTVAGLGADREAVAFVVRTLGISIVLTRRGGLADATAELGGLGLLQVLAFDSTGLNRSLDGHAGRPGVGTAVSPGLVLFHLRADELAGLPRPVLAYGFVEDVETADGLLGLAEGVVVRPDIASLMTAEHMAKRGAAAQLEPIRSGFGRGLLTPADRVL
jgi:glycerol-3-phosphate responsive antiterminator